MGDDVTGGAGQPYTVYQGADGGQEQQEQPGGRRRGRRRVFAFATSAVVLVAVLVVVLVLVLRDGGGVELRARGAPIEDASATLREAEERVGTLLQDAQETGAESATDDGAACWYSYPGADAEPNEFLRCGPVAFADSEPDTHWLEVPVSFRSDGDTTRVAVGNTVSRRTHALASGEDLLRPNGASPPAPETIDLERPAATAAEPGFAGAMVPEDVMIGLDQPEDGRVNGVAHSSEIVVLGTTDRVRLPDERFDGLTVFEAAEGERWLVFGLAADREPLALERIDYAVAVGEGRRSLRELSPPWDTGSVDEQLFAVSVPADGETVTLVVDDEVVEQSWSFTDERRTDDAIAVLYRDEDSRSVDVGEQFTLPYAVEDRLAAPGVPAFGEFEAVPGIDNSRSFGEVELSVEIAEARLGYAVEIVDFAGDLSGETTMATASGPDRALLFLDGVRGRWGAIEHEDFALTAEDAVLTLDDGTEINAIRIGAGVVESSGPGDTAGLGGSLPLFRGVPVWDVPADIESATVTIRPGTGDAFFGNANLDFQDGVIQFELDFGDPTPSDEPSGSGGPTDDGRPTDDGKAEAEQQAAPAGRSADVG